MFGVGLFVVDVCVVEVIVDVFLYWLDECLCEIGLVVVVGVGSSDLGLFVFDLFGNCRWWVDCFGRDVVDVFYWLVVWCYCDVGCFGGVVWVLYLYL